VSEARAVDRSGFTGGAAMMKLRTKRIVINRTEKKEGKRINAGEGMGSLLIVKCGGAA
jgi:hypothetical protein